MSRRTDQRLQDLIEAGIPPSKNMIHQAEQALKRARLISVKRRKKHEKKRRR